MLSMLKNLLNDKPASGSKDVAKERLRLVLLHDRASVAPQYLGLLKDDMVKVVSNYMEINEQDMQVNLNKEDQTMTLVANIPVAAVKRSPALAAESFIVAEPAIAAEPLIATEPVATEPVATDAYIDVEPQIAVAVQVQPAVVEALEEEEEDYPGYAI